MSGQKSIGTGAGLFLLTFLWVTSAQAGAYMGFSLGQSTLDDTAKGDTVSVDVDSTDLAWKVFGGGFAKWWGIEGGWVDLGNVQDKNKQGIKARIESEGFYLQGLGIWPVHEKFMIFGKAGIVFWDQDLRFSNGLGRDDNGSDGTWGAGIWWRPNTFFGMRAEWEYYDMQQEVTQISASVILHFN